MKITKEEFKYLLMKKKAQGIEHYKAFDLVKEFCNKIESAKFIKDKKPKNKEEFIEMFLRDIEIQKKITIKKR